MANQPMAWYKAYSETCKDDKILAIADQLQMTRNEVLGAWTSLLCLANTSPVRGAMYLTEQSHCTQHFLMLHACCTQQLIETFVTMNMLEIDENGAYRIKNWEKRQAKKDNSTERSRRSREKAKLAAQKAKEDAQKAIDATKNVACNGVATSENVACNGIELEIDKDNNNTDDYHDAFSETPAVQSTYKPPVNQPVGSFAEWNSYPSLLTDSQLMQIWFEVTGMPSIPTNRGNGSDSVNIVMGALHDQYRLHGSGTVEYLKRMYSAWRARNYKASNAGWLTEWAVTGDIPAQRQQETALNGNNNGKKQKLMPEVSW